MGKIEAKLRKSMLKEVNNACEAKMDELNTKVIEKIEKVENALDNKFDILLQKITEVSQNRSPKEEVKEKTEEKEVPAPKSSSQTPKQEIPNHQIPKTNTPKKEEEKPEDKFQKKPQESRLKWIQRCLKNANSFDEYKEVLRKAQILVMKDANTMGLEIIRMTMDQSPNLSGKPCYYFQYNGSNTTKKCTKNFIHPSKPFPEIFRIWQYQRKNFDIPLFMNICQLCYYLRKAGAEHPLYSCEILSDLDCFEEDPLGHQMVSMKRKSTDQEEKGLKNSEDNFVEADLDEDIKLLEIAGRVE